MAEDASKREEDRINRTLNNVGRRGARPMSWNVPQSSGLAGGPLGGSTVARNQNAQALKSMQEQIRDEDKKKEPAAAAAVVVSGRNSSMENRPSSASQQYTTPSGRNSSLEENRQASVVASNRGSVDSGPLERPSAVVSGRSSSMDSRPSSVASGRNSSLGGMDGEDDDRKMKLEEDRLTRWMKKGDATFADAKAPSNNVKNDVRVRSISVDSVAFPDHYHAASAASSGSKLTDLAVRFQDQLYQASKALRQKHTDDVAKYSFAAALAAKQIAELLSNDVDIINRARYLEEGVSVMRTSGDAEQHYEDVSGLLGRLFVSAIGAL